MKIGIVSDTHRHMEYLTKVVDWMTGKQKIGLLYHLGDDYDDVNDFAGRHIDVVQVPGIYDPRYRDGSLPAKLFENVLGVNILLIHSIEKDLSGDDRMKSDIILHGHTHSPELRFEETLFYMNPGHMKGPLEKSQPPSFGVLEIQDREVDAIIYTMEFKPLKTLKLERTENGFHRKYYDKA